MEVSSTQLSALQGDRERERGELLRDVEVSGGRGREGGRERMEEGWKR